MVPNAATLNRAAQEVANDRGWNAFRSNIPLSNNPYPTTSELHSEWVFGWKQGEYDSWVPSE